MSTVTTFAAPATKPRRGSSAVDAVIASAVDVARDAALEVAGPGQVGEHEGVRLDGHRVATHYFASTAPGYRGWRWAVTLARAPRAKTPTVCEVALLAGEEAVVAPPWLPWSERLQPRDVGRDDVLPYSPDDPRLMPGYAATGDADADQLAIYELGLGRARVLSPEGRAEASERWYAGVHGPLTRPGEAAGRTRSREGRVPPGQCSTCGFLLLMAGSMRTVFGVCANEWSPDDGQVVSMDHGCGAHSETDVLHGRRDWPDNAPVVDDLALEVFEREVPDVGEAQAVPEADSDEAQAVPAAHSDEAQGEPGGNASVDQAPAVPEADEAQAVLDGEAQAVLEGRARGAGRRRSAGGVRLRRRPGARGARGQRSAGGARGRRSPGRVGPKRRAGPAREPLTCATAHPRRTPSGPPQSARRPFPPGFPPRPDFARTRMSRRTTPAATTGTGSSSSSPRTPRMRPRPEEAVAASSCASRATKAAPCSPPRTPVPP